MTTRGTQIWVMEQIKLHQKHKFSLRNKSRLQKEQTKN
jgi:hypothetical protein